MQLNLFSQDKG